MRSLRTVLPLADALDEPVWTLPMALAWIATRDGRRAAELSDHWREAHGLPTGADPADLMMQLGLSEEDLGRAFHELRKGCLREAVTATAIVGASGPPRPLTPIEWRGIDLKLDDDGCAHVTAAGPIIQEVTFSADEVSEEWPEPNGTAPAGAKSADSSTAGVRHRSDYNDVRRLCFSLMDENGDFSADDKDWNRQARLEKALMDQVDVPQSTLRRYLKTWLPEWRRRKVGQEPIV